MDVVDNAERNRLEAVVDGHLARLDYVVKDGRLLVEHTVVPDELEGQGLGGTLVAAAVDKARAAGLAIVPHCSFTRSWLERHPDGHDGVEVDWAG